MLSDHEGLLRAVCESPDDDLPRLAYADWCDENGQPDRAEFIRLQIEAARLPEGDPRRDELSRRADEFLLAHRDDWLEGVKPGRDREVWMRRGFLEVVKLPAREFLRLADRLSRCPLRRLVALDAYEVEELAAHPLLSRLESLWLGLPLDADEVAALAQSPHLAGLRELELIGCGVGPEEIAALVEGAWPSLRRLGLLGNPLGDDGAATLAQARHLSGLTHLDLNDCQIGPAGALALAGATHWDRLEALDLGFTEGYNDWNEIGDEGLIALAAAPQFSRLTDLDLSGNALTDAGVLALAASPHLGRLRRLNLSFNQIGPEGVRALAHSGHLTALADLDLGHVGEGRGRGSPGRRGVEALTPSPMLDRIERLVLTDFGVTGAVADLLGRQPARLTSLSLVENSLTPDDVRALLAWPRLTQLTDLDLSCTGLTDEAVEALAACPSLARLRQLDLGGNHHTDRAALALAGSPHLAQLRSLEVLGHEFGPEGLAALRERFGERLKEE